MANVKISELPAGQTLDGTEILAAVQDGETIRISTQKVADLAGGGGYTVVTGTLSAGSTSLTLQNASITSNSLIFYGSEKLGVYPTSMTATTGAVVLTFEAQQTSLNVAIMVFGGAS